MKIRTIISGCMLFMVFPLFAQNVTPPAGAVLAANEGFVTFLNQAVTEETKTIVGFDAADDLSQAVLGNPFQLHDMSADAIRNFDGNSPLESILTQTDMWYFPIIIDDVIKMVLYVGKKDGVWMRAGLGSASLAGHMQNIIKQWPLENGYTPRLIKQNDIGGYLYYIPQAGKPNLTEIKSAFSMGLAKKSAGLKQLNETMQELKQRIYR